MIQFHTEDTEFVYNRLNYVNKQGLSTNVKAQRILHIMSL